MARSMRGVRSLLGLLVIATAIASCWLLDTPTKMTPVSTPSADPSLLYSGGKFYRYVTNNQYGRVPVASSSSISSGWSTPHDALRNAPWLAVANFWAPEVVQTGTSTFYLYYAATVTTASPANGNGSEHAIGVACGSSPNGPFDDCGLAPFGFSAWVVRDDVNHFGVIDPEVVFSGGRYYLLWSVDWGPAGRRANSPRKIQGCRLATNMKQCDTGVTNLLVAQGGPAWEHGTVESPAMGLGTDGHFYLFYSGGNFENAYATHEAICGTTPLSACTRINDGPIWGDGWNGLSNIGGLDLAEIPVGSGGGYVGVFHASPDFNPANGDPRVAYWSPTFWQN